MRLQRLNALIRCNTHCKTTRSHRWLIRELECRPGQCRSNLRNGTPSLSTGDLMTM